MRKDLDRFIFLLGDDDAEICLRSEE